MPEKPYEINEGSIEVLDKRRVTHGPIIPNYVYDLYSPIIGLTGLGLLGLLYRMTTADKSFNRLHDYMDAGRIGWEKLMKLLNLFEELSMIKVVKPVGMAKRKHMRTDIYLFDPPTSIPEKYVDLVRKKTIAKWLFEGIDSAGNLLEQQPTQDDLFVEQVVVKERKPRAKPVKDDSIAIRIRDHYKSLLTPTQQATFNYGMELKNAKKLEDFGFQMSWPIETLLEAVEGCWRWKQEDPFYKDRVHVNLALVFKHIATWVDKNPQLNTHINHALEASYGELHPRWRTLTEDDPDFWAIGTRLKCKGGTMVVESLDDYGGLGYVHEQENRIMLRKGE